MGLQIRSGKCVSIGGQARLPGFLEISYKMEFFQVKKQSSFKWDLSTPPSHTQKPLSGDTQEPWWQESDGQRPTGPAKPTQYAKPAGAQQPFTLQPPAAQQH